jgi:tetratricopeptide (TPR) repeat protein
MVVTTLAVVLAAAASAAPRPNPCAGLNRHRDDLVWVRANCRPLDKGDERVRQAEELLRQLTRRHDTRASLLVLGGAPGPQAYVTKERVIVVTTQALELCRRRGKRDLSGDKARTNLVFLLAHELAHSYREDHVTALLADQDTRYFEFAVASNTLRELAADQAALVDVARAGGDARHVLKGDLLWAWAAADGDQTWAKERQKALAAHAKAVGEALPLFDAGFDFLASGDYALAAEFLDTFGERARYDAREVRNNQAFALLQQAWYALAACDLTSARRFVLPGVFDPRTLAPAVTRGSGDPAETCRRDSTFRQSLDEALELLSAVEKQDPDYTPARLNLAAAYLLVGDGLGALAVVRGAPAAASDEERAALAAAEALSLYVHATEDRFPEGRERAVKKLRELLAEHPRDTAVAYNLARMLTEMGDLTAVKAWRAVLELEPPRVLVDSALRELKHQGVTISEDAPSSDDACAPLDPPPAGGLPELTLTKVRAKPLVTRQGTAQGLLRAPSKAEGVRAWRAYTRPGVQSVVLRAETWTEGVPVADLRRRHGTEEAELPLADGRRVLRFAPCELHDERGRMAFAYVVDGDTAVERLTFRPPGN